MWIRSLGWEDSPGGGHGNPLQCSCLENPHEQRSLVCCSTRGCKESGTTERLSTHTIIFYRPQHHFSRAYKVFDLLKGDPAKDHI